MIYQAVFERAADGTIWEYVRKLPGAVGSGDSLEKVRASLAEPAESATSKNRCGEKIVNDHG